ncbi:hypothetical protein BGZ94_004158 [Podila epigama]|nr:hypothetical protein BGZ94_004158 [Podila epigama]
MEAPESQDPWYEGSVAEAVQTANTNGSLLLVCVVQDNALDSESGQFEARFRKPAVLDTLNKENLISLKLLKDSPDGLMFGQIFPILMVPALYLIRNGLMTDFMNNTVDEDQMLERIQKAVNGHSQIPPPPAAILTPVATPPVASPAPTPSPEILSPTVSTTTASATSTTVINSSSGISNNNDNNDNNNSSSSSSSSNSPQSSSSSSATTSAGPSTSKQAPKVDKAEELKELMRQRKLWREKEEREAAKKRELERRTSSKVLSNAQRELTEKQSKKLRDQIEKDKREEAEYKKRVKQALEEDKARRKAEREKAQAALAASQSSSSLNSPRDPQQYPAEHDLPSPQIVRAQNSGLLEARNDAAPALACETSRLNIRLFDGSSIRNTFKATDSLEQVRKWINEAKGDENAYNIVQLIPSRTFTDETKMLRDLELCPSATLVLKKITSTSSAYGGAGGGAVPTLLGYGWSAVSLAGKLASSAISTVSYYAGGSGTGSGSEENSGSSSEIRDDTAAAKKKDRETSYNG